jgi:hypothetical protein
LLLPCVGLLWVPVYNFRDPTLFGFPFFYWYQLAWVPLSALPNTIRKNVVLLPAYTLMLGLLALLGYMVMRRISRSQARTTDLRAVHTLVHGDRAAGGLDGRPVRWHLSCVERRVEAPARAELRRHNGHGLCRADRICGECRDCYRREFCDCMAQAHA